MRTALVGLLVFWALPVTAAVPAAAENGFRRILISVCIFAGITMVSMLVGGLLAKRIAPASRENRRTLFALFNFVGVAAGGFAAMAFLRS